jgi:hypothetical protein
MESADVETRVRKGGRSDVETVEIRLIVDLKTNEIVNVKDKDGTVKNGLTPIDWENAKWPYQDIVVTVLEKPIGHGAHARSHCPPGYKHVTINGHPACVKI